MLKVESKYVMREERLRQLLLDIVGGGLCFGLIRAMKKGCRKDSDIRY